MTLRLYNTLTRQVEPLRVRDPGRVTFYTCGPTVYDDCHIGNFRSFLAADLLRRWIESPLCTIQNRDGSEHTGPRTVVHVMNITDVGHMTDDASADGGGVDKMEAAGERLREAKKSGKLPEGVAATVDPTNPYDIARFYTDRFVEDAKKLGLKVVNESDADPSLLPRATDNVKGMQRLIALLIDNGCAYVTSENTPAGPRRVVYFHVPSMGNYGRLSGNTLDSLRAGAGGRVTEGAQSTKRHPADFLLWKEDPSHTMKWDSPWGEGYPGWHVECSVMAANRLAPEEIWTRPLPGGEPIIDLHSGGEDNIFPHHECEIAQSCCAFNAAPDQGSFAGLWFHPRFLLVDGKKMSKSAGTFFTARELFAKGHDPAAIRLELIKAHYRSNINFSEQGLRDSSRQVERWRRFMESAGTPDPNADLLAHPAAQAVIDALSDDLNIAAAIGAINAWMTETLVPGAEDAAVLHAFDQILGVIGLAKPDAQSTDIGIFLPGVEPTPEVTSLLEARQAARQAKDYAESDRIRDQLAAMGLAIKDVAGGKVEVSRA